MIDLLPLSVWADTLWECAVLLLFLIASLLFYGWLADRAIFEGRGRVPGQRFGRTDLAIAGILLGLSVLVVATGWRDANEPAAAEAALPGAATMIVQVVVNTVVFFGIVLGMIVSLSFRQSRWWETFGLTALQPGAVLARAAILLLLALPLVSAALAMSHFLFFLGSGEDASSQELVRFLTKSPSVAAKTVAAVSAILLAPMEEEFLFRGYIYGVLRQYAGVPVGLIVNALLFAAIHLHAPSFGGLFVLAICLTLAYEWTGSLFVPMAVHALFNALSIVQIFAGGASG